MATESLPFLMSNEKEYVSPATALGATAPEMFNWSLDGSGSLIVSPG